MADIDHTKYSFASNGDTASEIPSSSLSFLSEYKGEKDLTKLRGTLTDMWTESKSKYHVYKCIQTFAFLHPRIALHPFYPTIVSALQGSNSGNHAIPTSKRVIDIGCCYGTDVRRMLHDGVPTSRIVASDLHSGYWDLGKKLFNDEERISSVETVFANWAVTKTDAPEREENPKAIDMKKYKNSALFIVATAVLHVFSKSQCETFLSNVYEALAHGGTFIGTCVGRRMEGVWLQRLEQDNSAPATAEEEARSRYLHSQESLKKAMETLGFTSVRVDLHPRDPQLYNNENDGKVQPEGTLFFRFQASKA
ncbi:hypothetical protein PhCBS80983_g01804 [Powellomyces hirtus]|uniref:Methyltransferase domain-containing protein n=1 Tax=Powellomyces hirtus TaxID=109895 RepID=A0A507E9G5_9FUNG|nr:hypothetical protein PhCBS80983_g01804 [Powellomyces hirtus]